MDPLEAAPVLPGETLAGKYRVERVLGQGGMGIVVAARHLELEQRVAIKFLLGARARAEESMDRFLREARAAAQVKSEHVCQVHDVARLESGEPYIVMEYLEGRDLAHKLKSEGPFSVQTATSWIIEACAALSEAHARRIVHRDLKPANLFLAERASGTTCIKVLDFGISKLPDLNDITATSTMMGSPVYMSPEQMESARDVDARTDIWSLGVILHELVAGEPPFAASNMIQLTVKVREEPAPSLASSAKGVDAELDAIVAKCLAKRPADRYATVAELAADLARFASEDAEHLAARLSRGRSVEPTALAPVSVPPPSVLAKSVGPPPSREAPAAFGVAPVSALAPGQATFAPLNTTARAAERGGARGSWWPWGVVLVGLVVGGAWIARGVGSDASPTAISVSAPTTSASAPPVETTTTTSPPPSAPAPSPPLVASAPSAAPPRPSPRTPPPSPPPRDVAPSASPTASGTVSAAAPPPPPPSATGGRRRPLDRDDPF